MKSFFSKKRNIIIFAISVMLVIAVTIIAVAFSEKNKVDVDNTTSTTENTSSTTITTENTTQTTTTTTEKQTEITTNKPVATTEKQETTTKKKFETTKKTQSTNKSNSRSARTKAEMLALTNLTESDLHYYESIGLGEYVLWAFFPNMPKEFAEMGKCLTALLL